MSDGGTPSRAWPCPTCGYVSPDLRCPRCDSLKVTSCTGACLTCVAAAACGTKAPHG